MFARVFALLPFVLLASASVKARDGEKCNTGEVQCCNMQSYQSACDNFDMERVLFAIGAAADLPVGLQCSPLSVIQASGNSCTQQTVCCDHNDFNGVVALGCTPVNVNA